MTAGLEALGNKEIGHEVGGGIVFVLEGVDVTVEYCRFRFVVDAVGELEVVGCDVNVAGDYFDIAEGFESA